MFCFNANQKKTPRGFTLIELLVVISIIALLLSILLPSLQQVKERGRRVVCASRQKQWLQAAAAYRVDWDGAIPFYWEIFGSIGGSYEVKNLWYEVLGHYLGDTSTEYGDLYINEARKCPSGKVAKAPLLTGNILDDWNCWVGVNYGGYYNSIWATRSKPLSAFVGYYEPYGNSSPVKLTGLKRPSQALMFLDTAHQSMYNPWDYPLNVDADGDGVLDSNMDSDFNWGAAGGLYNGAQFKIHSDGCNVALGDGHVEWIGVREFLENDGGSTPKLLHPYWKLK